MEKESFCFPVEAMPALIGYQGQKITDTKKVTGTSIRLKKTKDGRGIANISGVNRNSVITARRILELAVKHFQASCQPRKPITPQAPGRVEALIKFSDF